MMSSAGFYFPSIIVTTGALVIILIITFNRNYRLVSTFTLMILVAALLAQLAVFDAVPQTTELLLFDKLTFFLSALVLLIGFLICLPLTEWLEHLSGHKEEYCVLLLLAIQGALIVIASDHFAVFFSGLELMSLSVVAMIAYPRRDSFALEGAIKYLVLSALASIFILMAIAIVYCFTGMLSISGLADKLQLLAQQADLLYLCAVIFLLTGIAFKLSLVPCHLWVADLFQGSPLPTASLLATIPKVAVFVVLIRLFSFGEWNDHDTVIDIIAAIAVASMVAGNLLALLQRNIFRLLAYSSIGHFGYLLLAVLALKPAQAIVVDSSLAIEASAYYLFAYALTVVGIFSVLAQFPHYKSIDDLSGLFWERRSTALVLGLLLLSLAGIPLTIGFVGKFYLTLAAVNGELWWLLAALVVGSVIGLFYYLRIILIMVDAPVPGSNAEILPQGYLRGKLVIYAVAIAVLGIGVFPSILAEIIQKLSVM